MDVWRQFGALVKHLAVPPGTAGLSEKAYPNINVVAPGGSCNRQRCWDGLRPKAAVFTCLRQTVDVSTSGLNAVSLQQLASSQTSCVECRENLSSGFESDCKFPNFILVCLPYETREIGMDLVASPHSLKITRTCLYGTSFLVSTVTCLLTFV